LEGVRAQLRADPGAIREYAERILTASEDVHEPLMRGIAHRQLTVAAVLAGTAAEVRDLVREEQARFRAAGSLVASNDMELSLAGRPGILGRADRGRPRGGRLRGLGVG
jgi:hypothetical protein